MNKLVWILVSILGFIILSADALRSQTKRRSSKCLITRRATSKSSLKRRVTTTKAASASSYNNGKVLGRDAAREIISHPVNTGWIEFQFGAANTPVSRVFQFYSPTVTVLRITDMFCKGDGFNVYRTANGKKKLLGSTNKVSSDGCKTTTAIPQIAWTSDEWSRGEWVLPAGRNTISIEPESSPYDGGTAAIRFDVEGEEPVSDEEEEEVDEEDDDDDDEQEIKFIDNDGDESDAETKAYHYCKGVKGYGIVLDEVSGAKARNLCEAVGQEGVVITNNKRLQTAVWKTIRMCLDDKATVWIDDYNGTGRGGSINALTRKGKTLKTASLSNRNRLPVLCKTR